MRRRWSMWLSQFKPWLLVVSRPSGMLEIPYWRQRTALLRQRLWEDIAGPDSEAWIYVRRRRP